MNFKKIYWGFIFFVDIRMQNFDILPDVIGYILIFIGLSGLSQKNRKFEIAKWSSIPLIILSLGDFYRSPNLLNNYVIPSTNIPVLYLVIVVINLILIYNLCYGISEEAKKLNLFNLEIGSIRKWKFYFKCHCVTAVIFLLCGGNENMLIWLIIPVGLAYLVAYLSMIELMDTASKELEVKFNL